MYQVSQDYLDKLYTGSIRRRITGVVDNLVFTEDDLLGGSFCYVDKCINSADIKLGGVFVGQFDCTFLPAFASRIQRGTWRGRIVQFAIGLFLGYDANNEEIWEDIPCKPYIIDEATWSKTGVAITAYDAMWLLDKSINITTSTGTIRELTGLACKACGVEFGMTQAEYEALPNSDQVLGIYEENDLETWRDLISYCAAAVGGFATIDRAGKLVYRNWHTEADITIDVNDRYTGGNWSDFTTYYTGLSIVNIADERTEYYHVTPDTGLTMNLGSNPLLQYGTKETHGNQLMAILGALQNFVYTPFSSSSLIDPILDLGDVVEYANGLADDAICCIHKMEFKYSKGMKLTGYGKNPALFGARSKTDKDISGLMSKNQENQLITYSFMNAAEIEVAEGEEVSVLNIRFGTINPNLVKMLHEINFNLEIDEGEDSAEITAHYYLNGEEVDFSPISSWDNDGYHILPLMYFVDDLVGGRVYEWEVTLEISGGTASIDKGAVKAILEAQGLVATDEWDGVIDAEDLISAILGNGGFVVTGISENVGFDWKDVEFVNASDVISAVLGNGGFVVNITDSANIITQKDIYKVVSEDGTYQLISEDGDYHIESEE